MMSFLPCLLYCQNFSNRVLKVTSGNWTISGQLLCVYSQSSSRTAVMSGQKRPRAIDKEPISAPAKK